MPEPVASDGTLARVDAVREAGLGLVSRCLPKECGVGERIDRARACILVNADRWGVLGGCIYKARECVGNCIDALGEVGLGLVSRCLSVV